MEAWWKSPWLADAHDTSVRTLNQPLCCAHLQYVLVTSDDEDDGDGDGPSGEDEDDIDSVEPYKDDGDVDDLYEGEGLDYPRIQEDAVSTYSSVNAHPSPPSSDAQSVLSDADDEPEGAMVDCACIR